MSSRPYRQVRRAEATRATRDRIISAAREQLLRGGAFTVDGVAQRAGVARVTVYAQFGDRDQLREAVFDQLAESGGLGNLPEAFTQPTALDGLQRLVEIFSTFYATHRDVIRRLRALSVLEPDAGNRHQDRNARRRQAIRVLLSRVPAEAGSGRNADELEVTTSILLALTSYEFFDQLAMVNEPASVVAGRIWTLVHAVLQGGPR